MQSWNGHLPSRQSASTVGGLTIPPRDQSMDQLKQLRAAKPASERKRKSWLDEPKKVQRQITPAALRRILGSKGDMKRRHMRAQQIGQRSGGKEKYGDGENSDDIGAAAYSPRTLVTRRSHLRQITMALKRAGAIPRSMKIQDAALKCCSIKGIDIVTRALMKNKIKTGGAYLRTWKNFMARVETPPAHIVQHLELGVRALKRQLANQPVRQAPELDLIRMYKDIAIDEKWESSATPLVSAGPIHPLWAVLVCSVFMLRSTNVSSLKLEQLQVDVKARVDVLELRCRKNAIDSRPHHVMLSSTCGMAPVCPYCLGKAEGASSIGAIAVVGAGGTLPVGSGELFPVGTRELRALRTPATPIGGLKSWSKDLMSGWTIRRLGL